MNLGIASFAGTILYFGAIVALLLSIFWRPYVGLLYLVPLLPLQTIRYHLHEFPLGANVVDIILLSVCVGLWRRGESAFPQTPFNKLLLTYAIYTYILLWRGALFLQGDMPFWFNNVRLQDWKNYLLIPVVMFLVFSAIRETKHMRYLIYGMCVTVLLLDRAYFHTIKDRDFSHFSYDLRDAGAMGYAGVNGFAAFQAQIAIFLLTLYCFEKKTLLKLAYLGTAAFSIYCLLFSFSRGGYAAFLVGCVFLGVTKNRMLLVLVVLLLFTWQAVVPAAVQERIMMTEGEDGSGIDSSAGTRLTIWEDALQVFKGDPIFGTGFNTYQYMHRVGPYQDTHNMYVKVLVETGLAGLAIFVLLLWKMYCCGFHLFRTASDDFLASLGLGFAGLMVCVVAGNLFGDRWMYMQITGYTFALLGLTLRGQAITDQQQESAGLSEDVASPLEQDAQRMISVLGQS
ncbi:MAG TPA: O-antigen ligase family protein [Bryobacteraceae bacterium]|jgi:O-antigen ligase|nr:O-antigen ligase family protein [Bryobacteraceae bacterium]